MGSHRPSNPVTMAAAAVAQLTSRRVLAGRSSKAIVTGLPSALSRAYATDAASGTSKTLVFLEHKDGKLNPGSLNALSAASALGGEIVGLVTGEGESASKVAEAAKKLPLESCRRLGLRRQLAPGRPDWQDRRPVALHVCRHLRSDPASCGHEGLQVHRSDQQGPRGTQLPGRRRRTGGGSLRGRPRADQEAAEGVRRRHRLFGIQANMVR